MGETSEQKRVVGSNKILRKDIRSVPTVGAKNIARTEGVPQILQLNSPVLD